MPALISSVLSHPLQILAFLGKVMKIFILYRNDFSHNGKGINELKINLKYKTAAMQMQPWG